MEREGGEEREEAWSTVSLQRRAVVLAREGVGLYSGGLSVYITLYGISLFNFL